MGLMLSAPDLMRSVGNVSACAARETSMPQRATEHAFSLHFSSGELPRHQSHHREMRFSAAARRFSEL